MKNYLIAESRIKYIVVCVVSVGSLVGCAPRQSGELADARTQSAQVQGEKQTWMCNEERVLQQLSKAIGEANKISADVNYVYSEIKTLPQQKESSLASLDRLSCESKLHLVQASTGKTLDSVTIKYQLEEALDNAGAKKASLQFVPIRQDAVKAK